MTSCRMRVNGDARHPSRRDTDGVPSLSIPSARRRRAGATLPELIVVLVISSLSLSLAQPPLKRGYDRLMTRGAAREVATLFHTARAWAIASGRPTAVHLRDDIARAVVVRRDETLLVRTPGISFGVAMQSSRDSTAFTSIGLGFGAANLSVELSRGSAADTVFVSREGRVRIGTRRRQ